jgi:transposase
MTTATPAELPDSIEELRALALLQQDQLADQAATYEQMLATQQQMLTKQEQEITKQEQTVFEYREEVSQLREYIRLLKSQRFGPSSERTVPGQMGLFNEAETLSDEQSGEEESPERDDAWIEVPAHTRRKQGGRRPLPAFLPREEILHDLPEDQKVCANDPSHKLREIGREKLEQLAFIPATAKVLVHIRPKYACSYCKDGVKTAPMPPQPIPKSLATPSLLAQVATSKYVDALPLYRQEKIFNRIGVDLSRATLASWMIRMGELVEPLLDRMLQEIRQYDYVQVDETPFQVLKENGKRATTESYLWAMRGGEREHPLLFYEYAPTRAGEVASRLLDGFQGFMQTDGYKGYDALGKLPGIVHVGCFAHARRKFDEALRGQGKSRKPKSSPKESVARQGLKRINKLYELERFWRGASPDERYAFRQERTKPKLKELEQWLAASKERVPPTSLTGEALAYLESQWPKLERVLDDGRISLDTNAVERCIRPFVIGRRNWLFADTPKGATASARLYSLVETAKANGLEPWAYLATLFEKLPSATCAAEIEALLPRRIEMGDLRTATRLPHVSSG